MDEMKIKIGCETGLLVRKLEVIREGIDLIINGLDKINERYCECGAELRCCECGGQLNEVDDLMGYICKACEKCGERYAFKK